MHARITESTAPWCPRAWPDPADPATMLAEPGQAVPRGGGWIVRVKPYELTWCDASVAAQTMDAMDYSAHVFTDPACEMDAIIYRAGPTGYRLRRQHPAAPPRPSNVPLTMDPRPARVLNRDQAVASLDKTGLARLFFADAASGRGHLLYRRFDGHYALIAGA